VPFGETAQRRALLLIIPALALTEIHTNSKNRNHNHRSNANEKKILPNKTQIKRHIQPPPFAKRKARGIKSLYLDNAKARLMGVIALHRFSACASFS
jgi:hypothetical protein